MPEQGLLDQEFLLHLDYLLNAENPNFFQELRWLLSIGFSHFSFVSQDIASHNETDPVIW